MDPQRTLLEMLAYLRDGEWLDAQTMFTELVEWRKKGGFVPDLGKALDGLIEDETMFRLHEGE